MSSRRLLQSEKGVALLIALTAISFLTVMTIMLLNDVDRQTENASQLGRSVLLDAAIDAGLSVVQAAIHSDGKVNQHDSRHDAWAMIDSRHDAWKMIETDPLSEQLIDTTLSIQVEDLTGRLQVNALVEQAEQGEGDGDNPQGKQSASELHGEVWKRFLLSGRFAVQDEQQAEELLDALRDWLDPDDETRDYGEESSYYQALSPGYKSRNDKVRITEDLLYVKGMTPQLFFGDEEYEGIGKYITAVGTDGKVNINTASLPVLLALAPGLEEEAAEEMIAFREDSGNAEKLSEADWYKDVSGVPGDVTFDEETISVTAQGFGVTITARSGRMGRTAQGVIIRKKKGDQRLVQWQVR